MPYTERVSADNYIGIYPIDGQWLVTDGSMSAEMSDCQYRGSVISKHENKEDAQRVAFTRECQETIVEYGVIMLDELSEPCGRCYACVYDRDIISDDLEVCAQCKKPISESEEHCMSQAGTYHSMCEPSRKKRVDLRRSVQ